MSKYIIDVNDKNNVIQGSLFDTPITRVMDAVRSDIAFVFKRYTDEDPLPAPELLELLRGYMAEIEIAAQNEEFVDLDTASRVARQCEALISTIDSDTKEMNHRLIHAAVRYFVLSEDAESDTASPVGFDDDALVVEKVARELGREDLLREAT